MGPDRYNVYGSELKTDWLMQANPEYIEILGSIPGRCCQHQTSQLKRAAPCRHGKQVPDMLLTAARPKGRQAAILLKYENEDISEEIAPDVESFRYTDVAASQSDSVSITVNARAEKWKTTGCRRRA